jgi:hypothetical protein
MSAKLKLRDMRSAAFEDSTAAETDWPYIPGPDALTAARAVARELADGLPDMPRHPGLAEVEREHFGKFCVEVGAVHGWDILPDGWGNDESPAAELQPWFDAAADFALSGAAMGEASSYPLLTNAGLPFLTNDPLVKVWSALASLRAGLDHGALWDLLDRAGRLSGASAGAAVFMFNRTRATGKTQVAREILPDGYRDAADVTGLCAGRRGVYGVPSAINMSLQPGANGLKRVLFALPNFGHRGPDELSAKLLGMERSIPSSVVLEDDISGFDLSVSLAHQLCLHKVYARLLGTAWADMWLAVCQLSLVAGPVRSGWLGSLYRRKGGVTTSGMITTTLDGTIINLARVLYCVGKLLSAGPSAVIAALRSGTWNCLLFGDDTLVVMNSHVVDLDRWQTASLEFGFTCKPRFGRTFLMKYLGAQGGWWPLAARIHQRTLGGERPPREPILAAAGAVIRCQHSQYNPFMGAYQAASTRLYRMSGLNTRADFTGAFQSRFEELGGTARLSELLTTTTRGAAAYRLALTRAIEMGVLPSGVASTLGGVQTRRMLAWTAVGDGEPGLFERIQTALLEEGEPGKRSRKQLKRRLLQGT